MPFNRLALPFVLLLALSVYLTFTVDTVWAISSVILVVVLIGGLVLSPLINWWWWERFPPDISQKLQKLLGHKLLFYKQLDEQERREFRRRIYLFSHGTNFRAQGMEEVTEDIKLMIAVAPVVMSYRNESFLFEQFENVIVYPNTFPSPQFPKQFHASEIYEKDGVIMLCQEHIIRGFIEEDQYFSPAWYEYAKVYQLTYPDEHFGDWKTNNWDDLEKVCGFSKKALEQFIGLPNLDISAFGIACFFLYQERFQEHLPKMYALLDLVFHKNK